MLVDAKKSTKKSTKKTMKTSVPVICCRWKNLANCESPLMLKVAKDGNSFATVLKKSGVNIGIISQALGHQDIKTTQIYISKFDNE